MHGGAIVPHQYVAGPPGVAVHGLRAGRGGDDLSDERPAVMIAHAVDGVGVRGQIEGAAVIGRLRQVIRQRTGGSSSRSAGVMNSGSIWSREAA